MPTREQVIRQALTLARKRFADGGMLSDEEYLRRSREGGGWMTLPGVTPPPEEEGRSTTPAPSTPSSTTPMSLPSAAPTYSAPSYSTAPSTAPPAAPQSIYADTSSPVVGPSFSPLSPSPMVAPSQEEATPSTPSTVGPFGQLPSASTITPSLFSMPEENVGPTDVFGTTMGIRGAVEQPTTITTFPQDYTLSPTLGRPTAQEEETTQATTSSPYGTLSPGFIGGIPASQQFIDAMTQEEAAPSTTSSVGPFGSLPSGLTAQQSIGPYSFAENTETAMPDSLAFGTLPSTSFTAPVEQTTNYDWTGPYDPSGLQIGRAHV